MLPKDYESEQRVFFDAVDRIVFPVLSRLGYKKKVLKGRDMVIFDTSDLESRKSIDFMCYVKYGKKSFRVTYNSKNYYLKVIAPDSATINDESWKYNDKEHLENCLTDAVGKIQRIEGPIASGGMPSN